MAVGRGGVIHINVNCTDLDRSRSFYQDHLGMRAVTRTKPDSPQDGAAFGLRSAQWDAWMMAGPAGFRSPVIDLLQWIVPPPIPRPAGNPAGFTCVHVGSPPSGDGEDRLTIDPDGMPVQVKPGPPGLLGVTIGCTDIDRSRRFYEEIVELGDFVDLVPAEGEAPPAANTLGAWRMALATEDIDADVSQLRARGVSCLSEPAEMEMGPGLPALRFVLFPDPDGTMLELIERRPA